MKLYIYIFHLWPSFNAAIVGAGIGGTAAALHLRAAFGNTSELTVFESGKVGGRLATVEVDGHEYEAGGSIIHPLNLEMKSLVKELGEQLVMKIGMSYVECHLMFRTE